MTFDWILAGIASFVSLLVLWVPLARGMNLFLRARVATRRIAADELAKVREGAAEGDPQALALLFDQVEAESQSENHDALSQAFIRDASRQYVVNEYSSRYADPIAMYANILPPIGFVGTTIGLMVLFVSMHVAHDSLQLSALALALSSSIFALIGYATLEGLRIHLYGRLQRCLDAIG
ncbi:MAG: MotA/TolQ/ExbB proton channel family protein [Myxococcota bacterium]|jgi:biopolymer transport protein ExbB/TolQ|nr:MotA/TolQ/ExbB proton channel family protein [Myxococcota bacterium]